MTDWREPTAEELDRVLGRLGNEQHRRYFYERLNNPLWVRLLRERGVFDAPPQPWTDAAGDTRLPRWPEGEYLARVAPSVPGLAVEIIETAKATSNSLAHNAFVEVALAVPAEQSARRVRLVPSWLNSPSRGWLHARRLAEWVGHLARGGRGDAALTLARTLVEIRLVETAGTTGRRNMTRARVGVATWLDAVEYADVLQIMLPDLVTAAGVQAIEVLNNQLETWLRHGGQGVVAQRADSSWVWRPSIAQDEQNLGNTVEDALIDGIRDGARRLAESNSSEVAGLVAAFERREWTVFRRIALHVLAATIEESQQNSTILKMASDRVINAENLNDHSIVHEYSQLARELLPTLDAVGIEQWRNLIEAGPRVDEDQLRDRLARFEGERSVDQRVEDYRDAWRRDRLGAVRDTLPESLRQRYAELSERLGEADHSDFPFYMTAMWSGPTSPRTQQELLELNIDEMLAYLTDWRPELSFWPPGPSVEGLARELAAAVGSSPVVFADHAESFAVTRRSFARAILEGLEAALRESRAFAWPSVIRLCAAIAVHADDGDDRDARVADEDPSWRPAQRAAASLLLQGLQPSANEIPAEYADSVMSVLSTLTENADPDREQVQWNDDSGWDPVTRALNSVRGQAVRGIMAFAGWRVRQGASELDLGEVTTALDRRLDPAVDASPAVRSVYGQHFAQLLGALPEWAQSRVVGIFGSEYPLDPLQYAAGAAYLAFNRPSLRLVGALRPQYLTWARAVAAGDFDQEPLYGFGSIAERLGEHVLLLYSWGRLSISDTLLVEFLGTAPVEVRRRALGHLGWQLWRSSDAIPEDVLQRLQVLWESRRHAAVAETGDDRQQDSAGELAAFGWWLRSDRFDRRWAMDELLYALENGADVETMSVDVTEHLAKIAETDFELAVKILDHLLQSARGSWRMSQVVLEGTEILSRAVASGQQELMNDANGIIDQLGRSGFLDIRERVRGDQARRNAVGRDGAEGTRRG
jgi:hypothetical protein